jgi:hypothetical protein
LNGRKQADEVIKNIYLITKALDPTRPVIDTSGAYHVMTDIFDIHDYCQNAAEFAKHYEAPQNGGEPYNQFPDRQTYGGQPRFISEYGGIQWNNRGDAGWGYGEAPKSVEEFVERYSGLTGALLDNPSIFALCYTQLYDIEQEINGLYYYDRTPKFSETVMESLRAAMCRKAAIEE